jgi:CubicO group peptidase (beta-lactamase class C family)
MKKIIVLMILLSTCFNLSAEISKNQIAKIDELFLKWNKPDTPGVALGVIKNGELIYSKGYGVADLEHDVPITPSSVFYMASVSKQFITMGILLLEEQGKIDLDAEIQTYLPDFPRYDSPLTIRHFIHHTSGVRDFLTLWRLAGNSTLDHISEDAVYQLIKNQKTLNFTPGSQYLYSNSCYFMLAMIIEKVSGISIKEFGDRYLFEPLGMKNTHFHNDVEHIIKNRVFSYAPTKNNGYRNLIMRFDLVGSGGLYSNIEDMLLWDQNFYKNKLGKGKQDLIVKLHEEGLLNSGKSTKYAFGLSKSTYRGLKTVSHGGALAGYRTFFLRFPKQNTSIVILANVSNFKSGKNAKKIADIVLNDYLAQNKIKQENKQILPLKHVSVPIEKLKLYVGTYEVRTGVEVGVSLKNNVLSILEKWNNKSYNLAAINDDSFVKSDNSNFKLQFSDIKKMKAKRLAVDTGTSKRILKRKYELPDVNLEDYVGSYFSEELNVTYEVYLDNTSLKSKVLYNKPITLSPTNVEQFTFRSTVFNFERSNDQVISFTIDSGRVKGMKFVKLEG